jgi:hypothetical protein
MCRYGFYKYKCTYGCFNCQVGFKRRLMSDAMTEEEMNLMKVDGKLVEKDFHCPNCRTLMVNLGRDLRLPKKSEDEQWQCIKYLVDNKYNIYSCGCQGIGFVPHKMEEAIELIASVAINRKKNLYKEEQKTKQLEIKKLRKKNADILRTKLLLREVKKENLEHGKKVERGPKISFLNYTITNKKETETMLLNFLKNNAVEIPFEFIDENHQYSLSINVMNLNSEQILELKTYFE